MDDKNRIAKEEEKRTQFRVQYDELAAQFTRATYPMTEERLVKIKIQLVSLNDAMKWLLLPDHHQYMGLFSERHQILIDLVDARIRSARCLTTYAGKTSSVIEEPHPRASGDSPPLLIHPSNSDNDLVKAMSCDGSDHSWPGSPGAGRFRQREVESDIAARGRRGMNPRNFGHLMDSVPPRVPVHSRLGVTSQRQASTANFDYVEPGQGGIYSGLPSRRRSRSEYDKRADNLQSVIERTVPEKVPLPVFPPVALASNEKGLNYKEAPVKEPPYCLCCLMYKKKEVHKLWLCENFLRFEVKIRRECADAWDICRVCCKYGHLTCKGIVCKNSQCVNKHNPIFCFNDPLADVAENGRRFDAKKAQNARVEMVNPVSADELQRALEIIERAKLAIQPPKSVSKKQNRSSNKRK